MKSFIALMYHSLGDYPGNEYNIEFINFKEQMNLLRSEEYTVEGFRGFRKRINSGEWPDRYVLLTFDDGYKSFLKAAGYLNGVGFNATFFITKDWCKNKQNFLSDVEIKELGLTQEIGSHTVSHPCLTKLPQNSIRYEVFESKKWIEDLLQDHIYSLSIPNGFINAKVIKIALEVGYKLIGNSKEWWNRMDYTISSKVINRVAIRRSYSFGTFRNIVNLNLYFYLKRRIRTNLLSFPKYLFLR